MKRWQRKVYHPKAPEAKFFDSKKWANIRFMVLLRDGFSCTLCGKTFECDNLELQVHHVKPRCSGGKNKLSNLVTLCVKCHDLVEEDEISYVEKFPNLKGKVKMSPDNDWHKWVYGSHKNPRL